MFKTIKNARAIHRTVKATRIHNQEQRVIDLLRHHNADRPIMQLHLDRMQTAVDEKWISAIAA